MIWVNYTTLDNTLPDSVIGNFLRCLPKTKSDAIARLRDSKQATASALGLALLGQAAQQLGVSDFNYSQLIFSPAQKPRCSLGLEFNITHSASIIACAASLNSPLGIDTETAGRENTKLLRHAFNDDELAQIQNGERHYLEFWVKKEAVVKAAGVGLRAMKSVQLEQGRALYNGQQWHLHHLMLDKNEISYLASLQTKPVITCQKHAFVDCAEYCNSGQFQNQRYG